MHDHVREQWVDFNSPLEGLLTRLYADVLGLVTTGMGNLLDTFAGDPTDSAWRAVRPLVLGLPWTVSGGIAATPGEVESAWRAVRNDPKAAKQGWKYAVAIPANKIRLQLVDVEALILRKLETNDAALAKKFDDWEDRHPDAQMAVHSMAWAMGTDFTRKFPRFTASFTEGDYQAAAAECAISPPHGTIVERNRRNRMLLLNAERQGEPLVWRPTSP